MSSSTMGKLNFLKILFICISITLMLIPSNTEAQNRAGHNVTIRVIQTNSIGIEPVSNAIYEQDGLNVTNNKVEGYNLAWKLSGTNKRVTLSVQNDIHAGIFIIAGERELKFSTIPQDITDSLKGPTGNLNINYTRVEDKSEPVILCYTLVDS